MMSEMRDTMDTDDSTAHSPGSEPFAHLEAALAGRLDARPGNLTGSRLDIYAPSGSRELPPEVVVAELHFDGSRRATLEYDGGSLTFEDGDSGPVASLGSTTVLGASPLDGAGFEVSYLAGRYRAKLSPLRNTGVARSGGAEVCRVKGSIFGRSYTVTYREGLFPVAVFLLWQTALRRRRAFTVGVHG